MADKTLLDSRPSQIHKDVQGSDKSVPLSPQWLLPKPAENKTGVVALENQFTPLPDNANHLDVKKQAIGEGLIDNHKKKDVFRPSVLDSESGRRDHWRDEERDINSSARKDRWREGEREHTDNRRMDRWTDSSGKHYGETRRAPGERGTDLGNRDIHDQRRESKWNTRWGPGDKETDAVHEKWGDGNKEVDMILDKGSSPPYNRDGDHYRPWRSNSSYSRGRADPRHQTPGPNNQVTTFSHSWGRGENPAPTFSLGRGRIGSSVSPLTQNTPPRRSVIERGESGNGEPYSLKYSWTKLIDIYRTTDMRNPPKYLDGEVPSLTQQDPVEPLAICAPSSEESAILKGIDKGEILSSGAPQIIKDGSSGRTPVDSSQSRRSKFGSKDDLPFSLDDSRPEWSNAKVERSEGHEVFPSPKSAEGRFKVNNMDSSNTREGQKWQMGDDPIMRWQPSSSSRETQPHKISQQSPEDLVLFYKDPQGEIQGPFTGTDIISWYESGYFGIELQVRLANAPSDSPFCSLGDVMPHLRAKARPPPGFTTPKTDETLEASSRLNYSGVGKPHAVPSDVNVMKNDLRYKLGGATGAENMLLESLMVGNGSTALLDKFALSEGMQGYGRNNSSPVPPAGYNSLDDPYLLAKKMLLESQRSPHPYPFLPGRDAAPVTNMNDRSISSVSSGLNSWLNLPVQGEIDPLQDTHNKAFPAQSVFGVQQQRLQLQNPSVTNILAQSVDNPSNILTPEMLLSSGLSQDPQLLSLLQQQYLLQLQQLQGPVSPQQMSPLDKLLLLKQQQKQEEQQQIIRQQQQLLSQVLSEQHHNQRLGEPSFTPLQTGGLASGNVNVDHTASHNFSPNIGSETSVPLLQQLFANSTRQNNSSIPEQIVKDQQVSSVPADGIDMTFLSVKSNQYHLDQIVSHDESTKIAKSDMGSSIPAGNQLDVSVSEQLRVENEQEIPVRGSEEPEGLGEQQIGDSSNIREVKNTEPQGVKKISEKKSKKQKSSKVSTDSARNVSKSQHSKPSENERINIGSAKSGVLAAASVLEKEKLKSVNVSADDVDFLPGRNELPTLKYVDAGAGVTTETDNQQVQVANAPQVNMKTNTGQRAWKPAPGFKPKSLLEIQQEEQRRAQEEIAISDISASVSSMSVSTPWAGVIVNADHKAFSGTQLQTTSSEVNFPKLDSSSILKSQKSEEDLFWGDVYPKLSEREMEFSDSAPGVPFSSITDTKTEPAADVDFITAKDSKKSRKKSAKAKAKASGGKVAPATVVDVSVGSSPMDKVKQTRQVQQEKEVLPAVPSGPSLGDFVVWKEDSANAPAPAWFTDSGKVNKPTSLRDILKEQGKKVPSSSRGVQVPASQKPPTSQPNRGSTPSWSFSSSPAKTSSPIQINSQASSHSKHKVEDDLFWGSPEQPKPEAKQENSQLGTQRNLGSKNSTARGTLGGSLNQHKSTSGKHLDAMEFKEWCESECIRLAGSKDTSILESCLKQSRAKAEKLLIQNFGLFDPDHEFIDKFLDYKDFLTADVLEIAFTSHKDRKPDNTNVGSSDLGSVVADDGATKGGKKKGKKGKKVSPLVLGFNVVSNRIMMGEIQTVED